MLAKSKNSAKDGQKKKTAKSKTVKTSKSKSGPDAPLSKSNSSRSKTSKPKVKMQGDGSSVEVRHREFVAGITYTADNVGFTLLSHDRGFDGNPGATNMFPWLSGIARGYEQYNFQSLSVELISQNSASTAGQIALSWDFDWNDEEPTTKTALLTAQCGIQGKIWEDFQLGLPYDSLNSIPKRYIQEISGKIASDEDARLIHCGFLNIGISGVTAQTTVSFDLWVNYDVRLFVPRQPSERLSLVASQPKLGPTTPSTGPWTPFAVVKNGISIASAVPMVNELGSIRLVKNVLDQAGINATDLKAGADWIVQSVDKVTVQDESSSSDTISITDVNLAVFSPLHAGRFMLEVDIVANDNNESLNSRVVTLEPFGFSPGKVSVVRAVDYGGTWSTGLYLDVPQAYVGPLAFPEKSGKSTAQNNKAQSKSPANATPTSLFVPYGTLMRESFVVTIESDARQWRGLTSGNYSNYWQGFYITVQGANQFGDEDIMPAFVRLTSYPLSDAWIHAYEYLC